MPLVVGDGDHEAPDFVHGLGNLALKTSRCFLATHLLQRA